MRAQISPLMPINLLQVYMYCSPTRRSFTSGRFPTSINPNQASACANLLPRQFTWLSQKLKNASYVSDPQQACDADL